MPFKNNIFFPLYVEYVDEIFNPHIPQMRIIRIFRIFRIRMANPKHNTHVPFDAKKNVSLETALVSLSS